MASPNDIPEIKNLDQLLGKSLGRSVKILSQDSKLLTAAGENYGSIMLALNVKITDNENKAEQNLNLVAKLIPRNEMLKEIFQVQITFIKEFSVYNKIVPALRQLEDDNGVLDNRPSDLFCKCFGGRSNLQTEWGIVDDDSVLLLENLKTSGYENGDRLKGFDYDHATLILTNLARFHGSTIALKIQKPDVFKDTVYDTLEVQQMPAKIKESNITQFITGLRKLFLEVGDHVESYVDKVCENVTKSLLTSIYKKEDSQLPFATFCHCDFWVNNMMVRRDAKNKPISLKIVDFQTPQISSTIKDLLFFIYTSIAPDVLYEHVDDFLRIYYESFVKCLQEFNVPDLQPFEWKAFLNEAKLQSTESLNQIMFMYNIILLQRGHYSDMNEVNEDDLFNLDDASEDCRSRMKKTFDSFIKRRWI